jgi:hypothetical protein
MNTPNKSPAQYIAVPTVQKKKQMGVIIGIANDAPA